MKVTLRTADRVAEKNYAVLLLVRLGIKGFWSFWAFGFDLATDELKSVASFGKCNSIDSAGFRSPHDMRNFLNTAVAVYVFKHIICRLFCSLITTHDDRIEVNRQQQTVVKLLIHFVNLFPEITLINILTFVAHMC
ncbi:hypothetical protein T08_16072 [Trichinella sp. T8]|nr:hypothetical protein T08_16072 [Trichinella sp. T8]